MERLDLSEEVVAFIEACRAEYAAAAEIEDEAFAEEDRRDREHVLGPYARIKRDDDVLHNGRAYRVIGPARGEGWLYVYAEGMHGPASFIVEGRHITDRAPLDPEEDPLPIWLPKPDLPPALPMPVLTVEQLEALRKETLKKVDITSSALIRNGFEFEGIIFSMSNEAQIRYTNMMIAAAALPYPLPVNSKDDLTFLVLRDPEHTLSFCQGALQHVMGVVATGTLQKSIVRAMQTAAEMYAYEDPRGAALAPELLAQTAADMSTSQPLMAV